MNTKNTTSTTTPKPLLPRKRRLQVYIAHKIRDPRGAYYVEQHIREAEAIALELWKLGEQVGVPIGVVCPGANTRAMDGFVKDFTFLDGDLGIVAKSDAVVMAPGWVDSEGAKEEHRFALENKIPIFYWSVDQELFTKWAKRPVSPAPSAKPPVAPEKKDQIGTNDAGRLDVFDSTTGLKVFSNLDDFFDYVFGPIDRN